MSEERTPGELGSNEGLGACNDVACICAGNWRALVKEMEPRIGTRYTDRHGKEWRFAGLLHGDDDYYYCMTRKGKAQFLSCVGSIEGYHFMSQDRETVSVHAIRALAVEAIREATGCPDIKGNDGEYLADKMERLAMLAARGA